MRHHEPPGRRRLDQEDRQRPSSEPPAEESVLDLQRAAGNRAVSALLARQPAGTGGADTAEPMKEERGSTVTLGIGDGIVIPLESYSWDLPHQQVDVMFIANDAVSELHFAAASGKHYGTGWVSTVKMKSDLKDIVILAFSFSEASGDGRPFATMTVGFKEVEHKQVK